MFTNEHNLGSLLDISIPFECFSFGLWVGGNFGPCNDGNRWKSREIDEGNLLMASPVFGAEQRISEPLTALAVLTGPDGAP